MSQIVTLVNDDHFAAAAMGLPLTQGQLHRASLCDGFPAQQPRTGQQYQIIMDPHQIVNMDMGAFATLSKAIESLKLEGYTEDFIVKKDCLECQEGKFKIHHDDFVIDNSYRFDVDSDAGDQSILYAISSEKYQLKGILVNSYGIYSDSMTDKMLKKLSWKPQ